MILEQLLRVKARKELQGQNLFVLLRGDGVLNESKYLFVSESWADLMGGCYFDLKKIWKMTTKMIKILTRLFADSNK